MDMLTQNVLIYIVAAVIVALTVQMMFKEPVTEKLKVVKPRKKLVSDEQINFYQCPDEIDDIQFLHKLDMDQPYECPKPAQPTKQFFDDFYSFRDKTNLNSSMRMDTVDKVNDLYLSGNIQKARGYQNMKIKDLFDNLTSGPNLYERQCVRLPKFDNVNPEGWYHTTGTPGTSLTRDEWDYEDEQVINGGEIRLGLYGDDKYADDYMYLSAYEQ